MGTMNQGYYYNEGKKIGFDVEVEGFMTFTNVAHASKGGLIKDLLASGYTKDQITTERVVNENYTSETNW